MDDGYVDPLDEGPEVSERGSLALAVIGFVLAGAAVLPTGFSFLLGPLGMAAGLVANLKGRPSGFVAAVAAAVTTIVGLSLQSFLRPF